MVYHDDAVAERRWRILDFLELSPGHSLNEDVIRSLFRSAGYPTDVEAVRSDIRYLERHNCVVVKYYRLREARYLLVVELTAAGQQTWRCERIVPGVAERRPL